MNCLKKMYGILFLVAFVTCLVSCSNKGSFDKVSGNMSLSSEAQKESMLQSRVDSDKSKREITETEIKQKLVKTGSVDFEVNDIQETKNRIAALVKQFNAYVSRESVNSYGGNITYYEEIRVPVNLFDDFVNKVLGNADRIASKNIQVEDVTAEFMDVEARVKNKKDLEKTYTELLSKAKTVDEVLNIDKEIAAVREEIDSMEGRLKYLTDQAAYSTITLSYYKRDGGSDGWGYKFKIAFKKGWDGFIFFFVGLSYIWPFLIIGLVVLFVVRKIIKSRKAKNRES